MTRTEDQEKLIEAIRAGDRSALARAITLIESTRPEDRKAAARLIETLMPDSGQSIRIGITGIPGVGKSTFIEAFGLYLIKKGKKVGVLTVDPSSELSLGSILGDKTRMAELGRQKNAFIRPSPSAGKLGGVGAHTREAMIILEAAGYDVILVETVGAGQSETDVAGMTDLFMVLQIPGAGDELQGIKKGNLELADLIVINKAEKENKNKALKAVRDVKNALHIVKKEAGWEPPVLMCSAMKRTGMAEIWQAIGEYQESMTKTGKFSDKRARQNLNWMKAIIEEELLSGFYSSHGVKARLEKVRDRVKAGECSAREGAKILLKAFLGK